MGKKRRKAVYVPYDYETAYKNSLDKMEEANEESEEQSALMKRAMLGMYFRRLWIHTDANVRSTASRRE